MTAMLSASPLREGERIEVRGWIARRRDDFQPSPYPLPLEGRGDRHWNDAQRV